MILHSILMMPVITHSTNVIDECLVERCLAEASPHENVYANFHVERIGLKSGRFASHDCP